MSAKLASTVRTFADVDEEGPRAVGVLVGVGGGAVACPQGERDPVPPQGEPGGRDVLARAEERGRGGDGRVDLNVLILQEPQACYSDKNLLASYESPSSAPLKVCLHSCSTARCYQSMMVGIQSLDISC